MLLLDFMQCMNRVEELDNEDRNLFSVYVLMGKGLIDTDSTSSFAKFGSSASRACPACKVIPPVASMLQAALPVQEAMGMIF